MAKLEKPVLGLTEEALAFFRQTGKVGGERTASLYGKEQRRKWGKLGGRPVGSGTKNKDKDKKANADKKG
jgi:general stress protein YciG